MGERGGEGMSGRTKGDGERRGDPRPCRKELISSGTGDPRGDVGMVRMRGDVADRGDKCSKCPDWPAAERTSTGGTIMSDQSIGTPPTEYPTIESEKPRAGSARVLAHRRMSRALCAYDTVTQSTKNRCADTGTEDGPGESTREIVQEEEGSRRCVPDPAGEPPGLVSDLRMGDMGCPEGEVGTTGDTRCCTEADGDRPDGDSENEAPEDAEDGE